MRTFINIMIFNTLIIINSNIFIGMLIDYIMQVRIWCISCKHNLI